MSEDLLFLDSRVAQAESDIGEVKSEVENIQA
jgi:hypothetical protein